VNDQVSAATDWESCAKFTVSNATPLPTFGISIDIDAVELFNATVKFEPVNCNVPAVPNIVLPLCTCTPLPSAIIPLNPLPSPTNVPLKEPVNEFIVVPSNWEDEETIPAGLSAILFQVVWVILPLSTYLSS
jgi:hypothetical protein